MMSVEATRGEITKNSQPECYQRTPGTEPEILPPSSNNQALLPNLVVKGG